MSAERVIDTTSLGSFADIEESDERYRIDRMEYFVTEQRAITITKALDAGVPISTCARAGRSSVGSWGITGREGLSFCRLMAAPTLRSEVASQRPL